MFHPPASRQSCPVARVQHFDECVGKLLFGLPRRLPPRADEVIKPGNPLFLWDPGNGLLLGIFRAVSGLLELIDRAAWAARPGMETPLPWQVRKTDELSSSVFWLTSSRVQIFL